MVEKRLYGFCLDTKRATFNVYSFHLYLFPSLSYVAICAKQTATLGGI